MGATTNSNSGWFANACGRNVCDRMVRKQITAGHGTRSTAARGYLCLSLSRSRLRHFPALARFARLEQARDAARDQARNRARWLLTRLGGQPWSALLNLSGAYSPAQSLVGCPASTGRSRPQASRPMSQALARPSTGVERTGVKRFHG